jgi:predicted DsbA family dithiol-disulfide isomerase
MVTVDYFSDVLCVWAYGGQVRLDELWNKLGDQVVIRERFMTLFADTQTRIGEGWADRGGFSGFGEHVSEVCNQWEHTSVHPDVWNGCCPATCINAHLFLRAAALGMGIDDEAPQGGLRDHLHQLTSRVRRAFFEEGNDIGRLDVLYELLDGSDPAPGEVSAQIESGAAAAALHRDAELVRNYGVRGSPTYVFNDGRQMLYGNVGYRIIESNIRELLSRPGVEGEPSWC